MGSVLPLRLTAAGKVLLQHVLTSCSHGHHSWAAGTLACNITAAISKPTLARRGKAVLGVRQSGRGGGEAAEGGVESVTRPQTLQTIMSCGPTSRRQCCFCGPLQSSLTNTMFQMLASWFCFLQVRFSLCTAVSSLRPHPHSEQSTLQMEKTRSGPDV